MPQRTGTPNAPTVTLTDVELVRVGSWRASTGPVTIVRDDLEAVIAAANDPEVDRAPVRIGHTDPRFDGEPALGWVTNLRLSADGNVLIGDLVDVPAALAEVMPAAFRRRSVELAWGVRTASGKLHRMALTGLALLGVAAPAVKGLSDVLALYGRTATAGTIAASATGHAALELTATIADPLDAAELAVRTIAAAASTTIPDPVATPGHTGGREGNPASHGGGQQVNEQRIRELLGIEADADLEAAVQSLVKESGSAGTGGEGEGGAGTQGDPPKPAEGQTPPAGTAPAAPAGQAPAQPAQPAPAQVAASGTPGVVSLSAGQFEELQRQAAAGAEAAKTLAGQERERVLNAALSEGRIAPADAEAWKGRLEADLEGTKALLSSLTPAFPTVELGADGPRALPKDPDETAWAKFEQEVLGIPAEATTPGKDG